MTPPASVGINTFPNKKPKLFGDVILELDFLIDLPAINSTLACGLANGDWKDTGASKTITVNHPKNIVKIRFQGKGFVNSGVFQIRLLRDGIQIGVINNFGSGNTVWSRSEDFLNETLGTHTYKTQFRKENFAESSCVNQVSGYAILSESNDTHKVKNTNIING